MRKNLWKAVAVTVVLALGAMAMSALAADQPEKAAPCAMTAAKAAPATMKGCAMQGAAPATMKGCAMMSGAAGDMKCCGRCCCMQAGGKAGCAMGAKGGRGCGMQAGMGKGCGMQAKGHKGCGMMAGGMRGCTMGQKGGQRGCGMQDGMGPGGPMGCGMGPGAGMGMGMGMGMAGDPAMMKELGLTPEQQRRMADIHERLQRQSIQTEADLRVAQLDMQKLMQAENPDRAKIEAQIDRIAGLEAAMKKARIATRLEARSVLTPEQIRKMHEGPACGAKEEKPAKPAKPVK